MTKGDALAALACGLLLGCETKPAPSAVDAGTMVARPRVLADAGASDGAPTDAAADVRQMSSSSSTTILAPDAGAGTCKILRPPLMQTFGGPAAIRFVHAGGGEVAELVFNDGGHPQFSAALPGVRVPKEVPMPPKTALPGCAVARDVVYCPDETGAIHRTRGSGDADAVVAKSQPGTSIAAASIGDEPHIALAFLQENTTSEGQVREAQISLDDGPPRRLSEDGSGATAIDLMSVGDNLVALTIDARVAMTPTHVRIVRVQGDKLALGTDAVVFVGGPAERHTEGTLAAGKEGNVFALLALANGMDRFGTAAVHISHPPKDDEQSFWSFYPNGLDPAPVAASHGVSPIRVARVRPSAPEADSSRVLEIGNLEGSGEFLPKCILAEAAYIKDVKIEIDRQGTMWIFWRDTHGSHFERRALP